MRQNHVIKISDNGLVSLSDTLMDTPRTQTVEEVNTGEDQEAEGRGSSKAISICPQNGAAATSVNEEEELKTEETPADRACGASCT